MTTGRRVALGIGVPLCLALTANTGFDIVANVGRGKVPVDYRVPASARRVSVTTSGGNVTLRQGSGQATLTGTGDYSLVRPHITERIAAGEASFRYRCAVPEGTCEFDGTLTVTPGMAVSVWTGGGDVSADGITGAVNLSTGGGNVVADRVAGDLALNTGGGNVQATGVAATQVSADTGGGDITITFTTVPRDVQVSTGGGNITVIVPPGRAQYRVIPSTGGGSINDLVPVSSSSSNVITATSGGGDITIREAS